MNIKESVTNQAGDCPNEIAQALPAQSNQENKEASAGGCLPHPCSSSILSFELQDSELVICGCDRDEHGNPKLSKKEVKQAIQVLQHWVDGTLPSQNTTTEHWDSVASENSRNLEEWLENKTPISKVSTDFAEFEKSLNTSTEKVYTF